MEDGEEGLGGSLRGFDRFGELPKEFENGEFVTDKVGVFDLDPDHFVALPVADGVDVVVDHGVAGDIELLLGEGANVLEGEMMKAGFDILRNILEGALGWTGDHAIGELAVGKLGNKALDKLDPNDLDATKD